MFRIEMGLSFIEALEAAAQKEGITMSEFIRLGTQSRLKDMHGVEVDTGISPRSRNGTRRQRIGVKPKLNNTNQPMLLEKAKSAT